MTALMCRCPAISPEELEHSGMFTNTCTSVNWLNFSPQKPTWKLHWILHVLCFLFYKGFRLIVWNTFTMHQLLIVRVAHTDLPISQVSAFKDLLWRMLENFCKLLGSGNTLSLNISHTHQMPLVFCWSMIKDLLDLKKNNPTDYEDVKKEVGGQRGPFQRFKLYWVYKFTDFHFSQSMICWDIS